MRPKTRLLILLLCLRTFTCGQRDEGGGGAAGGVATRGFALAQTGREVALDDVRGEAGAGLAGRELGCVYLCEQEWRNVNEDLERCDVTHFFF